MTQTFWDLGYSVDPFPPLSEVLASNPALAERCRAMGWWARSIVEAEGGESRKDDGPAPVESASASTTQEAC